MIGQVPLPTLLVTHDQADARAFPERIVVIENGAITQEGSFAVRRGLRSLTIPTQKNHAAQTLAVVWIGPERFGRNEERQTVSVEQAGSATAQTFSAARRFVELASRFSFTSETRAGRARGSKQTE